MVTKQDYEDTFNELLDTSIKWRNLRLEDLIQLTVLLSNPEILMKKLGMSGEIHEMESRKRVRDFLFEFTDKWKFPLANALRKLTEE